MMKTNLRKLSKIVVVFFYPGKSKCESDRRFLFGGFWKVHKIIEGGKRGKAEASFVVAIFTDTARAGGGKKKPGVGSLLST